MNTYNVYDTSGNYLGSVKAASMSAACQEASDWFPNQALRVELAK